MVLRFVASIAVMVAVLAAAPGAHSRVVVLPTTTPTAAVPDLRAGESAADGPSIIFAALPDSLNAFTRLAQTIHFRIGSHALLWFQIRWRTETGIDIIVNEGYFDADDSITLDYRVPSANERTCRFWAYLSTDRTWQTQVWWGETARIGIRRRAIEFQWSLSPSRTLVPVDDSLAVAVALSWSPDDASEFPFLFCDLVHPTGRIAARAIGYNVSASTRTFVFPLRIPRRAAGDRLQLRCYLSDGFDPDGAILSEAFGPDVVVPAVPTSVSSQRLRLAEGLWWLDRKPVFLMGANLVSNWNRWDSLTVVRQVATMAEHGLNYIRLWWDWTFYEPTPGSFSAAFKERLATMLRELERRGIWVELVPVGNWGGWVFDMYRDHWWTDSVNQSAQYRYFRDVATTVRALGVRNIAYISLMQEGSYNFDWYDARLRPEGWRNYPGPLALAQASADWSAWLRINGRPPNWTFDSSMVEFGRWSSERFNELIALRARGVRDGGGGEFLVGIEGSQGGHEYDRRIPGWEASYYLKPDRWCHLVDVAEIHNYVPNGFTGYWAYERGIATYMDVVRRFGVTANVGEYQYTWASTGANRANNDSLPWAWDQMRTKTEHLRDLGVAGCALWCWADYDKRPFGLADTLLRPRPILDSLARWLERWMPVYALDRSALALWTDGHRTRTPRFERRASIATTSRDQFDLDPERFAPLHLPVFITHCRNDIRAFEFDVEYDSSTMRFVEPALVGEVAGEPYALAGAFSLDWSVSPIAYGTPAPVSSTTRLRIIGRSNEPLRIPETNSAGCLLDSVPLLYLRFERLRLGGPTVIGLRIDSLSGFTIDAGRLEPTRAGADSLATTPAVDGHGRALLRAYARPALAIVPDSLVEERGGALWLRDTLVLAPVDTLVRVAGLAVRDTVRGSLAMGTEAVAEGGAWLSVRTVTTPWLPGWTGSDPDDLPFELVLDVRGLDDTSTSTARVTFDAAELRQPLVLRVAVRPRSGVGGLAGTARDVGITVAPNPALPSTRLEVRIPERSLPIHRLECVDALGRVVVLDTEDPRTPGTPGVYFLRMITRGGIATVKVIVL